MDTKNYTACYFDVLGMKNKILNNADDALQSMWFVTHAKNKTVYIKNKIISRSFSDNFLSVSEINSNPQESLNDICQSIGYTYSFSLINGILIRGAIVEGELCITEESVLGKALLDAYYIESNVAIYPRIVIEISWAKEIASASLKNAFVIDNDGVVYLNCLLFVDKKYLSLQIDSIINAYIEESKMLKSKKLLKESSKIDWLINYLVKFKETNL